jgi:hypothetical protein
MIVTETPKFLSEVLLSQELRNYKGDIDKVPQTECNEQRQNQIQPSTFSASPTIPHFT